MIKYNISLSLIISNIDFFLKYLFFTHRLFLPCHLYRGI